MALVITAGSCFTVWIADLITQYGVGNGSSMIIGAGIISQIPAMIAALDAQYLQEVTAGVILKLIKFTHLWISSSGQTKTALRQ